MSIRYTDSWDEIQEELIKMHTSMGDERLLPKYAFEIKYAVEAIDQQKVMAGLQGNLLEQQIESIQYSKKLGKATWVLAILTGLLFLSTFAYSIISYQALQGSIEQIQALSELSAVTREEVAAIDNLQESLKVVPEAIDRVGKTISILPSIQKKIEEGPPHSTPQRKRLK